VSTPAPRKSLGQHFLVDDNILGVIVRLAELDVADVALEIGPGLGVLTSVLSSHCSHVHAVELDRRLEPHLRGIASAPNVSLHWGDALRLDLSNLEPAPTKLVANLPYNVATPIVAESLDRLPGIDLWCVMVQREVADRFSAVPSTKAYALPDDFAGVRRVVEGAFAHRRKTLANSLQLADVTSREKAVAALVSLGADPSVRAEALEPPAFVELTRRLA